MKYVCVHFFKNIIILKNREVGVEDLKYHQGVEGEAPLRWGVEGEDLNSQGVGEEEETLLFFLNQFFSSQQLRLQCGAYPLV